MTDKKHQPLSPAMSGDETPDNKIGDEKYTERKTAKRNKQTDAQDEHARITSGRRRIAARKNRSRRLLAGHRPGWTQPPF